MGKKVENKIQKIISNKSNENVIISSKAKKKKSWSSVTSKYNVVGKKLKKLQKNKKSKKLDPTILKSRCKIFNPIIMLE